jgi:hypothetical protein
LAAEPSSCSRARHFVIDHLHQWHRDELLDSAGLCATELATNAVLHSREPFVLTVRIAGDGVRIDVLDNCPAQLPLTTPGHGSAVDLTSWGTGGRGMQIVASLASRWGVSTTDESKTVWVELRQEGSSSPLDPVLSIYADVSPLAEAVDLVYFDLPVRAAVSSGIQTEEVIREFQLDQGTSRRRTPAEAAHFFELVDRSAPVRLAGRHGALRMSADGRERFDLALRCSPDALIALSELRRVLAATGSELGVPQAPVSDDVTAFRAWIEEEGTRQRHGRPPSPACPLP